MPKSKYSQHLEYYRSQHKTLGCKITHLIGIPVIFISIPMLLFDWRKSLFLFSAGWLLQFIGHYVFEKNSPVLLSDKRHPATIVSALIYAFEHWLDTLKSLYSLKNKNNGRPRHLPLKKTYFLEKDGKP